MFSPAIRKPHLLHRRDRDEASPSPPPAAPAHTPSPRGFAIPDRPTTGTPAPWTSSSLLARISTSKRTDRSGDSDQIQPVHVAEFPQVVRNAQASLLQKNFSGKNIFAGGIDKETSLAWMICGNELFIWNYLASVAKDCLVLEVPSSLIGHKDANPLPVPGSIHKCIAIATEPTGDGTATVAIYWRGSTRLYKFDLPWDAGKVLDASIIPSAEDRDEGAWVVLTEKAGIWAIPEKAVLVGGVEPPERSLSRKVNEALHKLRAAGAFEKEGAATLTIMEHGEKLSGIIQLRELQNALIQQRSSTHLSPQLKTQSTGALWNLIQLVGEKARRNTVLLMDHENAEVFYSRVSDIEDLFYCLSHQLQYIISREEHPSVQVQRALEVATACITLVHAALHYRKEHKEWYPSPEGLITWNSHLVVRSGIWSLASFIMELLGESGAADMSMKSNLWSQLEGLTDILLEAYIGLLTAKFERGDEHGVLVQEYCERRDELLGSLYNLAKQIVEAKYQESRDGTDNPGLKESIFRGVISPILATAKRHEGYQTLWQICSDLNDSVLLRSLMHDSVGPHGGFSFFVFKELVNSRHYSKLLRLGEEFQEELASFLKDRSDLLWLHEIYLNQFSSASETLHTYALRGSPDEDASVTTSRKPLSFAERRRLLYLSKIAATAGKDMDYDLKVARIEADMRILKLQEEIVQHDPESAQVKYTTALLDPSELIEMCLKRDQDLSLKAFEVFASTSSSFRSSNRGLLEACWMNATNQDDWVKLSQVSTSEGWSDEVIQESLQGTVLFKASRICYSPDSLVYDGTFEDVLPVKKEDVHLRGLETKCLSVEEVLMQHKDFPDAGKLMMAAVIMGKELPYTAAEPVEMDT
nr:unnamed protein product [Digitaria exilis]